MEINSFNILLIFLFCYLLKCPFHFSSTEPIFFSRLCPVCKVRHPTHRVLFSSCGHTTCHVCQMENRLHTNSDQCPHCKIESGWISIIEEEDPSPILPECTCKRIRRTIGQWKDQLRSLFKFAN